MVSETKPQNLSDIFNVMKDHRISGMLRLPDGTSLCFYNGLPMQLPIGNDGQAEAESVSALVRSMRQLSGLSQSAFSAQQGIPLGTLRRWEQGQNCPLAGKDLMGLILQLTR